MGKRKFPNLTLADDLLIGEVHNFFFQVLGYSVLKKYSLNWFQLWM